jgi:hypothetical protein
MRLWTALSHSHTRFDDLLLMVVAVGSAVFWVGVAGGLIPGVVAGILVFYYVARKLVAAHEELQPKD